MFLAPLGRSIMTAGIAESVKKGQPELLPGAEVNTPGPAPETSGIPEARGVSLLGYLIGLGEGLMDYCVPPGLERDTEPYRRASLISGFGFLGFIFGMFYSAFYLVIGHYLGASIIAVCSAGVAGVPFLQRVTRSARVAGNVLTFLLEAGFIALCGIEGGVNGHAIGWLASVPLCALLLVSGPEVIFWCCVAVCATGVYVYLFAAGIRLPLRYPAELHPMVTAVGFIGLALFMSLLGFIFEGGRRRAFNRMERAAFSLSQVNTRLKRLHAEKNEFLAVAAHDLKNPLNVVTGFAELIATGRNSSPEQDKQDAQHIIEAADRMIAILTQLLDVNAIEQGHFPLEITVCDLGVISRQVTSAFSATAGKKRISIYEAGPLEPARIIADPKATCRILENLLSNALKYSPVGGDIYVRMRIMPDAVVWEVQDHGAGIPLAEQAHLFHRFTKLSTRPTAGESSTGLGLSIVKMLAEAMNGAVQCQSKPGEGSTFSVRLPFAGAETEPAEEAASI